jgi:hypothetical protein
MKNAYFSYINLTIYFSFTNYILFLQFTYFLFPYYYKLIPIKNQIDIPLFNDKINKNHNKKDW